MNYLKSLAFGQYESEVKQCECDGSSSGSGPLMVKITFDSSSNTMTMDKTWQQINDAESHVFYREVDDLGGIGKDYFFLGSIMHYPDAPAEASPYRVQMYSFEANNDQTAGQVYRSSFLTDSPDGYPVHSGGSS